MAEYKGLVKVGCYFFGREESAILTMDIYRLGNIGITYTNNNTLNVWSIYIPTFGYSSGLRGFS